MWDERADTLIHWALSTQITQMCRCMRFCCSDAFLRHPASLGFPPSIRWEGGSEWQQVGGHPRHHRSSQDVLQRASWASLHIRILQRLCQRHQWVTVSEDHAVTRRLGRTVFVPNSATRWCSAHVWPAVCLCAAECSDYKQRVNSIKDLIKKLPKPNHDTMQVLFKHLRR